MIREQNNLVGFGSILFSSWVDECCNSTTVFCRNKLKRFRKKFDNSLNRRNGSVISRIQASGKYLGSGSDKVGDNGKSRYHPFEDILESEATEVGEGRLTAAETSRTIVEVYPLLS